MSGLVAADCTASIQWSQPDMTVLSAGRRPPVPMPKDLFGPAWPLLEAIADGTASPVDYAAMGFLAACASLIGGKRRVRPYPTSLWSEPAILWCGVVGDPSSRKSPALDMVIEPLRSIERTHADLQKGALREWREEAELANAVNAEWEKAVRAAANKGGTAPSLPDGATVPDEPVRRRTLVMDATPEALAVILAGNPMGTLHFRDELAGWVLSFERYSPGGREFWLEAYGGRTFVIDRKGSKDPIMVPFNGVSVLGGIQPAKLASMLLAVEDDGLVARILLGWPDKRPFIRPSRPADMHLLEAIYQRLDGLAFGQDAEGRDTAITVPLALDAADMFEQWQKDNERVDDDSGSLFKSFVGKMDGTVLRLALVAELSAWAASGGPEPCVITVASLSSATQWVDGYAKPMAERVYGDAVLPAVERNAAVLARYIRKNRLTSINKRDLKRSPHKSALTQLQKAEAMNDAIERLIDAGWLVEHFTREGDTSGRMRGDYVVNPAVYRDD